VSDRHRRRVAGRGVAGVVARGIVLGTGVRLIASCAARAGRVRVSVATESSNDAFQLAEWLGSLLRRHSSEKMERC
jgi:hypothetical protein